MTADLRHRRDRRRDGRRQPRRRAGAARPRAAGSRPRTTPGYHATGRSAAFWEECYGGPGSRAADARLGAVPARARLALRRAARSTSRASDDAAELEAFIARFAGSGRADRAARRAPRSSERVPGLRPEWTLAICEPACADIDVAGLHQHYLARGARGRASSCARRPGSRRPSAKARAGGCRSARAGEARARVLVDAAGRLGRRGRRARRRARRSASRRCGARSPSCAPIRRRPPTCRWCSTSPGSSTSSPSTAGCGSARTTRRRAPPCDAAPEELDVAIAIDRFEQVVDWRVDAVERKWAGLRSFAPDRLPVYGFDPRRAGLLLVRRAGRLRHPDRARRGAARRAAAARAAARRDDRERSTPALYAPGAVRASAAPPPRRRRPAGRPARSRDGRRGP